MSRRGLLRRGLKEGVVAAAKDVAGAGPTARDAGRRGAGVGLGVEAAVGGVVDIRVAMRGTSESFHRVLGGRRGVPSMMVKRGPQLVQLVKG